MNEISRSLQSEYDLWFKEMANPKITVLPIFAYYWTFSFCRVEKEMFYWRAKF